MPKIKTLPENVVAKTAAGQVVERPASVVKELVENALDASATQITIDIAKAGLKKLRVVDNGIGMDEHDLRLSYLPHTTSKIYLEQDLTGIKSFGFRGEALASICAVAKVSIASRLANEPVGRKLEITKGIMDSLVRVGMPYGTEIIVNDLFYNTPARKKFLKSDKTEYRHILDSLVSIALAHTNIGFTFINDGKTIFNLPSQSLIDRIKVLLGMSFAVNLFPVKNTADHFEVTGFLAKPQPANESKINQYIYVNNRPVANQLVSSSIKEAYGGLLEPKAHPAFIVFLAMPYDLVDVNVHPRKEQVHFWDDTFITDFIFDSVHTVLNNFDQTYQTDIHGNHLDYVTRDKKAADFAFSTLKSTVKKWDMRKPQETFDDEIMQLNNLYLVTQDTKGLVLIDQHAAHERILYEQFLSEFAKGTASKQQVKLKEAILIDLSLKEADLLLENLSLLVELGFDIEPFGKNEFKIRKVPAVFKDLDLKTLVLEVIDNINQNKKDKSPNKKILQTIAYLACRGAIKAGDYLTPTQRKDLLIKLSETTSNYTCPHGRPVKVEVPLKELHKLFKRVK